MNFRGAATLCVGLFVLLGPTRAFCQVYVPTEQDIQNVENEIETHDISNDGCGQNISLTNGRVTGISSNLCPYTFNFLNHYQLSDFYGNISLEVDVSGKIFFQQTFNQNTMLTASYFDGVGTQFKDLFDTSKNGGNGAGSYGTFTYTGVEAVNATATIFGLKAVASVAANSTTIDVALPQLTRFGPNGFQLQGVGPDRTAAAEDLVTVAQALPKPQLQELEQSVLAFWEATQPNDPLAGNPGSVQGIAVRNALDLSVDDSVLEGETASGTGEESGGRKTGGAPSQAGSWLIGFAYGQSFGYGANTDSIDANFEKNWPIFQGQRTRLQLTIPISYSNVGGSQTFQGGVALGLEQPLLDGRWSLEPEVSWGATAANRLQSMGNLFTGTLTSRFRIDGVGRGYFILGDMVGYTSTLSTAMVGTDLNPHVVNWVFRNGLAYELPLDLMVFGRGSSVRASYAYTNYIGSPLSVEQFSEATLTFGVRSREGQLHNTYEALRLGVTAIWGDKYTQVGGSIGFRF